MTILPFSILVVPIDSPLTNAGLTSSSPPSSRLTAPLVLALAPARYCKFSASRRAILARISFGR